MPQKMIVPALIAVVVIVAAWGLSRVSHDSGQTVEVPGATTPSQTGSSSSGFAPGFELTDVMNGNEISLEDYRGKVVLIDFWATWCRPCRMEIPHFIELREELHGEGFEIIGVSVDRKPGVVKPFAEEWKINYPVVVDAGAVSTAYGGIRSSPTAFLVDRKGKIIDTFVGYRPKVVFEQAIRRALKQG